MLPSTHKVFQFFTPQDIEITLHTTFIFSTAYKVIHWLNVVSVYRGTDFCSIVGDSISECIAPLGSYVAWLGALCEAMPCTWGQSWAVSFSPVDFWILTRCWHQCPNSQLLPSAKLLSSFAHAAWERGMMVQVWTSCPSWVSEVIIRFRDTGSSPIPKIFHALERLETLPPC